MGKFDERQFRDAVGRFPTGVAVVAAHPVGHDPVGMTVSSLTSVSLQPALLSFGIARSARSLPAFLQASQFGISVLADDQDDISLSFARAGHNKWSSVGPIAGAAGCPIIRPNIVAFECEKYACYNGGDHVIILARVLRLEAGEKTSPLIFFRSQYHRLWASPAKQIRKASCSRESH